MGSLCLLEGQTGQHAFGLSNCGLIGDITLSQLVWSEFFKANPITATLMMFLIFFAIIGFLVSTLVVFKCVVVYRQRRRSAVVTKPKNTPILKNVRTTIGKVNKIS
jgi:uncharacterized paraquat-inducible protein A